MTQKLEFIFDRVEGEDHLQSIGFCYQIGLIHYLSLSQTTNSDSSKLKELADDNFKVDENGRMFYKCVENTVGKGEIALYEQFLLFPQCFQKTCTANTQEPGFVWERVNILPGSKYLLPLKNVNF